MPTLGPYRHANADLPRALGDRHQQDVHNANTAHQQRHRRHTQQQVRHHLVGVLPGLGDFRPVAHGEVIFLPRRDVMPLVQQLGDLLSGFPHRLRGNDHGMNRVDAAHELRPQHAPLSRQEGHEQHIVLVLPRGILALGYQDPDHPKGDVLDAHQGAEGLLPGTKEMLHHRLAQDDHLGGTLGLPLVEEAPSSHRPGRDPLIGGRHAFGHRGPVLIAGDDLDCLLQGVAHVGHSRAVLLNSEGVTDGQGGAASPARAHAIGGGGTRHDRQQIVAETDDLLLDNGFGAGADTDHGDDGGHADDNAQHSQGGAELVALQGVQRHAQSHEEELHCCTPFMLREIGCFNVIVLDITGKKDFPHHTFPARESLASPTTAATLSRQPGTWLRKMLAARWRLAPA